MYRVRVLYAVAAYYSDGSFKLPGFWAGHLKRLTLVSGNLPPTESRLRVPSILFVVGIVERRFALVQRLAAESRIMFGSHSRGN
jgi:hypothetical protein